MRLLRPVHPMVSYAVENLAAIPLRMVVAFPVAIIALVVTGASRLPRDPLLWAIFLVSLLGGWLITFLANAAIGTLALWTGSSVKLMDVWLALYMVFSGYLIPVELLTRGLDRASALRLLLGQWIWVGLFLLGVRALWRKGLQRFAAYGGCRRSGATGGCSGCRSAAPSCSGSSTARTSCWTGSSRSSGR